SATDVQEATRLLAAVLAIPADHRYPPLALTPQRQKQRTLEVLVEQLAGLTGQRPVLAVYEDAHWIDPSPSDRLDLVIQRVQRLPALVLIPFPPEFPPPWTSHAHVTRLSLSRLRAFRCLGQWGRSCGAGRWSRRATANKEARRCARVWLICGPPAPVFGSRPFFR